MTAAGSLVRVDADLLLHGALRLEAEAEGWVRPWRFSEAQVRALGSCRAWHPGLYRQMARATAGVRLEFETDSSEVAIEVALDAEPSGTRAVLADVDGPGAESRAHDGISCESDGRRLGVRMPPPGETSVAFSLDDPAAAPAEGVMQLPGMGAVHRVRVWLPCLRGCAVRSVVGNGSFVRPVEGRPELLVLGDSLAQGFVCGDPSLSWAQLLADELGLDLVNQGVGGQVFQPGTLSGVARTVRPAAVVVEFGANYRYEPCGELQVGRDVRDYLDEVSRLWPDVDTWVVTPLWHDETPWPTHERSCFPLVAQMVAREVARHGQMGLVDGLRLMDHSPGIMADGYEHPGPEGSAQIARRLALATEARRVSQRELGERALAALEGAPRRSLPIAEALRRKAGRVLVAREGCVVLRAPGGVQMVWARGEGRDLVRDAAAALVEPTRVLVLEPSVADDVAKACGLTRKMPCHLAIWRSGMRAEADPTKDVRPLGEGHLGLVRRMMSHPEYQTEDETLRLLREGRVLGGFVGDELVGFVGEQPEGSMGMLEVLPDFRRHGWGAALEAAKINQLVDRGEVPWCDVWPDNVASVRLQRRLGLTVLPAGEACYLAAPGGGRADSTQS